MQEASINSIGLDYDSFREGAYASSGESALRWYALYVKSRHEFFTDKELRKKGIETYLPSVTRSRQWKDRRKVIEFPLFPGYLFVRIDSQGSWRHVVKTAGAVKLVSSVPGFPSSIPDTEIESIKILLASERDYDIYPSLLEGTTVRIVRGPLKGAEGILMKKNGHSLFIVGIELLGRSIGVQLYADDLEAAQ